MSMQHTLARSHTLTRVSRRGMRACGERTCAKRGGRGAVAKWQGVQRIVLPATLTVCICPSPRRGGAGTSQFRPAARNATAARALRVCVCVCVLRCCMPTCACCGRQDAGLRCSQCKGVHYCSAACQRADWVQHRGACKLT
ncbi:zinc finger MYND domain-containing protein, partial [archaeon]